MKNLVITDNLLELNGKVSYEKDGYTSFSHAVIDIRDIQSVVYNESKSVFSLFFGLLFLILSVLAFVLGSLIDPSPVIRDSSAGTMFVISIILIFYHIKTVKTVCCINGNIYYFGFNINGEYKKFIQDILVIKNNP